MNKTIPLAAAYAIAMASAAIAAPPPAAVTTSADHTVVFAHASTTSTHFTPPLAHRSNLPVIYQNFATSYSKGPYNAFTGSAVSGPKTPHGQLWAASAFTPTTNASVQEVDVPVGFNFGLHNTLLLHIYADASGIPGQDLWAHKIAVTQTFGACCDIIAVPLKAPLRLTAGTQYWVGITSLDGAQDVWASWSFNVADQVTETLNAENNGTGWQTRSWAPAVAFGVYGK